MHRIFKVARDERDARPHRATPSLRRSTSSRAFERASAREDFPIASRRVERSREGENQRDCVRFIQRACGIENWRATCWKRARVMAQGTPTLKRQSTTEFLGSLLRGNSLEALGEAEEDVDDGRVGALTRAATVKSSGDESEPGSPFSDVRIGSRRRERFGSSLGSDRMPPDPFPLSEVTTFARGDSASGLASFLGASEPTATRKSARHAGGGSGAKKANVETRTTVRSEKASSSKRVVHAEKPNAAGFKAASFGRVNAQHGAGDAGDHHGWSYIPKRADRRRAIARFTTAIIRAAGQQSFISREGVGYRKAFDRFLLETYGETFAEGGYWYKNAEIEPFFRVILYVATEGKINLANDDVKYLFTKKEERQAAEWVLDEDVLAKLGLTARDVASVYEGKPRKSQAGFVRGTPLKVPPMTSMPEQPAPFLEGIVRAKMRSTSATVEGSMAPPPPRPRTPVALLVPGSNLSSPSAVPLDIQRLFDTIPKPNFQGVNATKSRQMSRQYSSDLARLVSEFNANPSSGDEFVMQYLARSASELDAIVAMQQNEAAAKDNKRATEDADQARSTRASKRRR